MVKRFDYEVLLCYNICMIGNVSQHNKFHKSNNVRYSVVAVSSLAIQRNQTIL
jgi:hypothetical protein